MPASALDRWDDGLLNPGPHQHPFGAHRCRLPEKGWEQGFPGGSPDRCCLRDCLSLSAGCGPASPGGSTAARGPGMAGGRRGAGALSHLGRSDPDRPPQRGGCGAAGPRRARPGTWWGQRAQAGGRFRAGRRPAPASGRTGPGRLAWRRGICSRQAAGGGLIRAISCCIRLAAGQQRVARRWANNPDAGTRRSAPIAVGAGEGDLAEQCQQRGG